MRAEQKCATVHNLTALSFSTASIACILSVTTVAMNGLMLHIILRGQRNRPKSAGVVSIALVNTVVADLLTGLLTDTVVTASHIIEGLQVGVRREIIVSGHVVHFLTTGAALFSVTLLSLDRIGAFMWPLRYKKSQLRPKIRVWHMFLSVWGLSAMFIILYFQLGFIKYLAIYAAVNISIPAVLMVLTIFVYKKKFGGKRSSSHPSVLSNLPNSNKPPKPNTIKNQELIQSKPKIIEPVDNEREGNGSFNSSNSRTDDDGHGKSQSHTVRFDTRGQKTSVGSTKSRGKVSIYQLEVPDDSGNESFSSKTRADSLDDGFDSTYSAAGSVPATTLRRRKRRTDKRLLRALIINFVVFILTYLPTAIFITYLNVCVDCNCVSVHVLRDAIGLFVRLASLLRPITFAVCTTSLREAFRKILSWK